MYDWWYMYISNSKQTDKHNRDSHVHLFKYEIVFRDCHFFHQLQVLGEAAESGSEAGDDSTLDVEEVPMTPATASAGATNAGASAIPKTTSVEDLAKKKQQGRLSMGSGLRPPAVGKCE